MGLFLDESGYINWGNIVGGTVIVGIITAIGNPIFFVNPGEEVVIKRLGSLKTETYGEGMKLKFPFVDSVIKTTLQVQKIPVDGVGFSKDLQDIDIDVEVAFRVNPGSSPNIIRSNRNLETLVNNILRPTVQEKIKAASSKRTATKSVQDRQSLKLDIENGVKEVLEPFGIKIEQITISNLEFTGKFKEAVEQKQIAQQDAEKAKFLAQKAEQEALAEINRAKGRAESQRLQLQVLKEKGGEQFVKLEAIKKWDGKYPTTVVGEGGIPLIQIGEPVK